jgi:hypothetical protein
MNSQKERFRFIATCQENCLAESSDKRTPSIQLSFIASSMILPGQDPVPVDRNFKADLWLTDATLDRSLETVGKVFGWYGDDLEELNHNRTLFAGKKAMLVCEEEEYNGEKRMKVCFVNPISSVYAVKPERAKEIAADFKEKLAKFRAGSKAARRTAADLASGPGNAQGVDEELPF